MKDYIRKIDEIIINPNHYPVKKYNLKGKQGVHVGSFAIIFEVNEEQVIFHRFKHHDFVYE